MVATVLNQTVYGDVVVSLSADAAILDSLEPVLDMELLSTDPEDTEDDSFSAFSGEAVCQSNALSSVRSAMEP
jgi:hypothetical protein